MDSKKIDLLYTTLHEAARTDNVTSAKMCLAAGADVNAGDKNAATPLHWAAAWGACAVARMLLDNGAEVNARDCYRNTPLHSVALHGSFPRGDIPRSRESQVPYVKMVELLVAYGADLEAMNEDGRIPLHRAHDINNDVRKALLRAKKLVDGSGESAPAHDDAADALTQCGGLQNCDVNVSAAFFNLHCHGLKLRTERLEKRLDGSPVSIWDYIPAVRIPVLELQPKAGEPAHHAALFFDGLCKFKAGDAILGPDGSLSVMVGRGEGRIWGEERGQADTPPRKLRWWTSKKLGFDMVEFWPLAPDLCEWVSLYYGRQP